MKTSNLMDKKPLKYFLQLNYPIQVVKDEDGEWVASIPNLPGCNSFGDTVEEAITNVEKTKELWIEGQYAAGNEIPEPTNDDFSGRFVLRIPRSLHRSLSFEAQEQAVSLNQYVSTLLAQRSTMETVFRTFFNACESWRDAWMEQYRHQGGISYYGTNLRRNAEFVTHLRKPSAHRRFLLTGDHLLVEKNR